eukprot:gene17328-22872_t
MLTIKEYFGDKIGLYVQFIGHYTSFLLIPSSIGFILQIAVIATEFWKRKEIRIALEWGNLNFESNEVDRADFTVKVLNDRENHRTDTQYEDAMVSKIFLFQFVNSYASFFYIAFIAESLGECSKDTCMASLATNLGIIFGTRLLTNNILGILVPYLMYQYKYNEEMALYGGKIVRPEKEYLLQKYDVMISSIENYAEVAIQYGYTALFASALPVASLFAFFSNLVESKGKAWTLLNLHQRPVLKGAQDIGTWQAIFLLMAVITVITNAGLTVFTMTVFDDYSLTIRLWIFLIFQWICFSTQYIVMEVIPDIPEEIEVQIQRTEHICEKIIEQVSDEPEEDHEVSSKVDAGPSLVLQEYPRYGVTIEEHNKERGTRQKIDEPPTPFRYSSESDQSEAESVDSNNSSRRRRHIKKKSIQFASNNEKPHEVMNEWSQLHAKLNYENFKQLENYNDMNDEMSIEDSPGSNANIPNDMDDSSDYEINQKKNEFKEKRLAHYNEFKILQALKNKLLSEDDDDDRSIADSKK